MTNSTVDESVWANLDSWDPKHADPDKETAVILALTWYPGRMLSGSKSSYREKFPKHLVIFNANLVLASTGKVWYGDVDAHLDKVVLLAARKSLGEDLYFLYEHDARFDHENDPVEQLLPRAKFIVHDDKIEVLDKYYIEHIGQYI